jgi:hypothetical protein
MELHHGFDLAGQALAFNAWVFHYRRT